MTFSSSKMSTHAHPRQNMIALVAICLATLMFSLEISSVPVILPTLEVLWHAEFKDMQWIMNAYTIGCTTILMAAGTLADRFGRKRILIITLILFGIASLICGLAQNVNVLIWGRFFQGISGGAMLICQIAALSHQFQEGAERSRAFAIWGVILGIGLGFGPIIGSMIIALLNWQWVLLIHVPIAAIAVLLVSTHVIESKDPDAKKLDIWGVVTLSLSVFGFAYFITQGPELGFGSTTALAIFVASIFGLFLFWTVEQKNPYPMFDFSVFRARNFSGAIMGSIGMNFSFWPFIIYLPIYFQSGLGYDVVSTGLSLLAYTLPTLVIPPVAERLSLRYQSGIIIPLGLFTIGLGFMLMWFGASVTHVSWLTMLPGCALAGVGLGLTNTPVTNTATAAVSSSRAGMASGIDMSARLITLAINIALMGFILQVGVMSYLKSALNTAFNPTQLLLLSTKIASGSLTSLTQSFPALSVLDSTGVIAHAALNRGFTLVMLYGGLGVWILAFLSFLIFNVKRRQVVIN
ncbi:MFS transporter [Aquirhabdus sp.]|uniref:MFS transporter n=1 Tax=Aquirhabdus sp. TaxID=2824160 RepID=UPI00396C50C6